MILKQCQLRDARRLVRVATETDTVLHGGRLVELGRARRCAIMCAEAVWWRCHRRIIADYLLQRGIRAVHIMGPDRLDPAALTPGPQSLADGSILYPGS